MKDVEILLRGFAMLVKGDKYRPSMAKFLNQFSRTQRISTIMNSADLKYSCIPSSLAARIYLGTLFIAPRADSVQ